MRKPASTINRWKVLVTRGISRVTGGPNSVAVGLQSFHEQVFPASGHVDTGAITHDDIAAVATDIPVDLIEIDNKGMMDADKEIEIAQLLFYIF